MSIPFFTAQNLAQADEIRHGFFGREGGISVGIYEGLNVGLGSRDNPDHIAQNRARVLQAMGADQLCTVYQCHTANVVMVTADYTGSDTPADAMVTAIPGKLLGILTADCVPVLLADPVAKVIGAAHAGWKGAVGGVVEATLVAMEKLGATRTNIIAAIGPCIAQQSYEVGPEFVDRLLAAEANNSRFFIPSMRKNHSLFDIAGYVRSRLVLSGISSIEQIVRDTCAEDDKFFSYRRSCLRLEPDYGREISCILLK
jgi:YfiH family protein